MFYDIDRLMFILESTGKTYNTEKIKKAYEYAREMHSGQYRKSGEEYINHPVAVAEIVAGLGHRYSAAAVPSACPVQRQNVIDQLKQIFCRSLSL